MPSSYRHMKAGQVCIKMTNLVKFSFSERATKNCAFLLMVLMFTKQMPKTHFFLHWPQPGSITQHNLKEEKKIFEVCIKKTNLVMFSFSERATKNCAFLFTVFMFTISKCLKLTFSYTGGRRIDNTGGRRFDNTT